LIADAAVLGSSFALETLVAISGKSEAQVRAALADLLQREVLEISADKLSPQRGTYRFAQEMLRQVAYDTISRRDRKARHLVVAAHLRSTFAGDGDEVIAVVARHYLDALAAVPDDPDVAQLRELAIDALVRAGERSQRAGAQGPAGVTYAAAAACIEERSGDREGSVTAAQMYERAADAETLAMAYDDAIEHAKRARQLHLAAGDVRAAARAQSSAGRALRRAGRFTEAREELTDALTVLRPDADPDTILALVELATLEVFGGGAGAQTVSAEAVEVGEALGVDAGLMSRLFTIRGLAHAFSGSRPQAIAYLRESTRLAERGNDIGSLARSFLNLADVLAVTDPQASADAARTAAEYGRRHGDREMVAVAVANLAGAMLIMGEWDQADAALANVAEEGLDDHPYIAAYRAFMSAMRGDAVGAAARLPLVASLRESEDQQDQATIDLVEAWTFAARAEPAEALRLTRDIVARVDGLGVGAEAVRWAWPLGVRMAHEIGDDDAVRDLIAVVDAFPRGHVPPVVRAERDLAVARLAARNADPGARDLFANAVAGLRALESPYYLASGLLDHAEFLHTQGEISAGVALIEEARVIGNALRVQPILDRASRLDRQAAVHS